MKKLSALVLAGAVASVAISLHLKRPNAWPGSTFITDTTKCGSVAGSTGCIPIVNNSGTIGYVPFIPEAN